jgi:hypothetical protein
VHFARTPKNLLTPMGVLAPASAHARVASSYLCNLGPHAKFLNPKTTFENTPI